MIYTVIVKVGWNEAHFEFHDIEKAGEFARDIILHSVETKDTDAITNVKIEAAFSEKVEFNDCKELTVR